MSTDRGKNIKRNIFANILSIYTLINRIYMLYSFGLFFIISFCLFSPVTSWADMCSIKGFEAVEKAISSGRPITAKQISGKGSCQIMERVVLVSAAQDGGGVVCEVTFFDGENLSGGWKIENISFSGPNFSIKERDKWPSSNLKILLRVSIDQGETDILRVKKVDLSGPDCDDWVDAFGPA